MGEALPLYRPLPNVREFFKCNVWQRVLVGSNRSGKTLNAAIEVAHIATGTDPYKKLPKEHGRMMCVGFDEDHIADVQWRKLYNPGAFTIIRDPETGLWRAVTFDPNNPSKLLAYDEAHRADWKPAPSLIPARMLGKIAWKQRSKNLPDVVPFKNGWELMFFSSKAHPKAGIDANFLWIDEEIQNEGWYHEGLPRLLDRDGKLLWSATPQSSTEVFYYVQQQCKVKPDLYAQFHIKVADNPFIPEQAKKQWREGFLTEEEYQMRYEGINVYAGLRVYPEFDPQGVHGVEPFNIPRDWPIWIAMDPGVQVTAVLFSALRPDSKQIHVWSELYLKRHTSEQTAEEVAATLAGREPESVIIDFKGSSQTLQTMDVTIEERYRQCFADAGIQTRYGFLPGSPDRLARTQCVKDWLALSRETGKPFLVVHKGKCPNLEREMKLQMFKKTNRHERQRVPDSHSVDCLEYTAAHNPTPTARSTPELTTTVDTYAADAFYRREKRRQRYRPQAVSLGPLPNARRTD